MSVKICDLPFYKGILGARVPVVLKRKFRSVREAHSCEIGLNNLLVIKLFL